MQATIPTKLLSPTLTPTPTTERDGAPSDGNDTPNNGALIGGVLSAVSVAILAAILVVVVVLILLRRRHKKTGNGSIDNPVYAQGKYLPLMFSVYPRHCQISPCQVLLDLLDLLHRLIQR